MYVHHLLPHYRYKKGESQTNVEIMNEDDFSALLRQEEEYVFCYTIVLSFFLSFFLSFLVCGVSVSVYLSLIDLLLPACIL
jgi:hypothetical protein